MKMKICLLLALLMIASAQDPREDKELLEKIFGTPPPSASTVGATSQEPPTSSMTTTQRLEDITVKPTQQPAVFTDKFGTSCQCVPYYLCDPNHVGVDVNNASVTGYGVLDVRFGEETDRKCQVSVEVCCTQPEDPVTAPKPKPDVSKLKGCGYRNPKGLGITINGAGSEAQIGEFPWVVAVMSSKNDSYGGVGALIHPQVVITGAHIANKFEPGSIKIRAGEWDTQTDKEEYDYQERDVSDVVVHENFQPRSLKNDIALLRLAKPVELAEHINLICMPEQEEVFDSHKNCVANGWGKDVFGLAGRYSVILKKVEIDMMPYDRCLELLKKTRLGHNFKLHSSFVCAGGEPGKDTCQGDGGAPLACPIGDNRYKLTGLVAWGIGCGGKDVPAVYVNVPAFREWVDEQMEEWGYQATSYRINLD